MGLYGENFTKKASQNGNLPSREAITTGQGKPEGFEAEVNCWSDNG
jgi:hypothetical protein